MFELMVLLSIFLCCLLLLFIAFYQGVYLKRKALRLPEAAGERSSIRHSGFSVLHIGESPVAGVGVRDIRQGLTHKVVSRLSQDLNRELDWEIQAKNGARVIDSLSFDAEIQEPDVLVMTFGVNDTTAFTRGSVFSNQMMLCGHRFSGDNTRVFVTSIPEINRFPLLPPPLSGLLGVKAYLLNRQAQQLCQHQGWEFIKGEVNPVSSLMAEDGYHPNEQGYKVWADIIADKIAENFKP